MNSSICILTLFSLAFLSLGAMSAEGYAREGTFDWRRDWAVQKGFSISVDTEGYHFPTAIAFVQNPGDRPEDPLYFVTELRGKVKVVTNDRTVHMFAENFFQLTPKEELPSGQGQAGLAGICLEPERGYVFVTFAYRDDSGILRNNMMRFESIPQTFSLKPSSMAAFTDVFLPYETGLAHHIGPCQIKDELIYVSVGEAWQPIKAQQIDAMFGKVIRMTLDGDPVGGNPFYRDDDRKKAANYVWAYGLRNPFGLKIVEGRIFAADNGMKIDRFLEIKRGQNYLWNGSDDSIASNAAFVFVPSIAPVQMDFYDHGTAMFPDVYAQAFFLATAAFDKGRRQFPGIMTIKYSLAESKVSSAPVYFVMYRGDREQMVTGLAFGPDGLYYAPLYANRLGMSPVLKVSYTPDQDYPITLVQTDDPYLLMIEKGCVGCHQIDNEWGYGGVAGPPLEGKVLVPRLLDRLHSDAYMKSLTELDALNHEPQRSYREEVRSTIGLERVRVWMKYRIQEPTFDNLYSQMPNLGLSSDEALLITNYFLDAYERNAGIAARTKTAIARLIRSPVRFGHVLIAAVVGFALGGFCFALGRWVLRRFVI